MKTRAKKIAVYVCSVLYIYFGLVVMSLKETHDG
jgi:hypothetical protein